MRKPDQDLLFKAIADQTRRSILSILRDAPGMNVNELCGHFEISRFAVMKHLNILEAAALVVSHRDITSRRLSVDLQPLQELRDGWFAELLGHR